MNKERRSNNIKRKVMEQIETGRLNMRPVYIFKLEHSMVLGLVLFCSLLSGLGLILIESWIIRARSTNGLWNEYGELLWADFSWLWVGFALLGIIGGLIGYEHVGHNYRQIWVKRWIVVIGLSIFLACFFALLDRWLLFI
jgi:hypothetical protein